MPSRTDRQPGQGGNRVSTWSREFLIAQVVIVAIIAGTLVFAVSSEDRGLIVSPTLPQADVGPGIGISIGSEITVSGSPVECPDSEGLASDCETLMSLKRTLAGDAVLNWGEDLAASEWEGVVVGGQPARVVGLNLTTAGLSGSLPSELGDLSELRLLHLYGNDLTGEIPPELGRLSNLNTLDLGDNGLSGPIPPEVGRLSSLTSLDLSFNQLSGEVPAQLGDVERLEWLVIAENDLSGSVAEILERLPNLEYLSIYGNRLSGCIPSRHREVDGFLGDLPFCDAR